MEAIDLLITVGDARVFERSPQGRAGFVAAHAAPTIGARCGGGDAFNSGCAMCSLVCSPWSFTATQRPGSLTRPLDKDVPSKITAPHRSIQAVTVSPKKNTP